MAGANTETKILRVYGENANIANSPITMGAIPTNTTVGTSTIQYGPLSVNMIPIDTKEDGKPSIALTPRPSLKATRASSSAFNVMGAFYNPVTGGIVTYLMTNTGVHQIYSGGLTVFDTLIHNTGAILGATSVGATEFYDGTNRYFVLCNGVGKPYYIDTGNTVTQIVAANCPSAPCPFIVYLDGALFVATQNYIHNSEFGNITSWPGYVRAKEQYPENIQALVKHKNSIVAFGNTSAEFFFNAGYSGTSPLARQETYTTKVGMVRQISMLGEVPFVSYMDDTYFIGRTLESSPGIYKLSNFKITKVSPQYVDSILNYYINSGGLADHIGVRLGLIVYRGIPGVVVSCIKSYTEGVNPTFVFFDSKNYWGYWTSRYTSNTSSISFTNASLKLNTFAPKFIVGSDYITHWISHDFDANTTYAGYFRDRFDGDTSYTYSALQDEYVTGGTTVSTDYAIRFSSQDAGSLKNKHFKKMFILDMRQADPAQITPTTNISARINIQDLTSNTTVISMSNQEDSMITNLGTGRKIVVELTWTGDVISSIGGIELHYNEGEQ